MTVLTKCTECFKSLGVSSRMEIYRFLEERGPLSVSQITREIKLTQPTVSYHLKEMKENGLLSSAKKGKEVFYGINNSCPHDLLNCVLIPSKV